MAISNRLVVDFCREQVDDEFDFFLVSTSDKFIPSGAKCLDSKEGVCAESIAFENGKTLYIMTKKGITTKIRLVQNLSDDKLSVKKVSSNEIPNYILFRLFLYSLNNYETENLSFNNLTGKFYIYKPDWMKKDKSSFVAIGINIDSKMDIVLEAATFAKLSLFKGNPKVKDYPKYIFSNKNNALKRVFTSLEEDVYIKKGVYNKKAEIPFLTISQIDIRNNKVFYLYYVLGLLSKKYTDYLTINFDSIEVISSIGVEKNKSFMDNAYKEFVMQEINCVNYVDGKEYDDEFKELLETLQKAAESTFSVSSTVSEKKSNIVFIHNKDYYEQKKHPDPYKTIQRNAVVQCITVEDSAEKIIDDNEAIINTIIKEVVIKNDILHRHKITLDKWEDYQFDGDLIFGKEKEGKHYFMVLHKDGSFDFYDKTNDFSSFDMEILNRCSDLLTDNKGKEKTIIASCDGSINVISRTNRFPLPDKSIFELEVISRSKESREKYLNGLVDINLYQEDEQLYYSSSIKGSGMNTKIVHAPHLYKVDIISGKNIMPEILATLSTTFVKYKSFTVLPYPIKYLNEYILMKSD